MNLKLKHIVTITLISLMCQESFYLLDNISPIFGLLTRISKIFFLAGGLILFSSLLISKTTPSLQLKKMVSTGFIVVFLILFLIKADTTGYTASGTLKTAFEVYSVLFLKYACFLSLFVYTTKKNLIKKPLIVFLLVLIFTPYLFIHSSFLSIDYSKLATFLSRAWTLDYGDVLVISFFTTLPLLNKTEKGLIFILTTYTIFLIGSRTNFYLVALIFISSITFDLYRRHKKSMIILGVVGALFLNNYSQKIETNNRMFAILNLSLDQSFIERQSFVKKGIEDFKDNVIFGNFGGQTKIFVPSKQRSPRWGGYIHDFRSYWRQFGLMGVLFTTITFLLALKFIKESYYRELSIYVLAVSLFSRSFVFPYMFIILGLWMQNRKYQ